ncbi:homeobox protein Hox-B3-like [Schistocerca americana]|uniref:homeobox protein Hox-B3-like n=1 Tax=Schistocerca americana TaxID=7009 RepID=UPI001F4F44D0|nr:homeobox protein Hox-B3-like [Schistocerca americana]
MFCDCDSTPAANETSQGRDIKTVVISQAVTAAEGPHANGATAATGDQRARSWNRLPPDSSRRLGGRAITQPGYLPHQPPWRDPPPMACRPQHLPRRPGARTSLRHPKLPSPHFRLTIVSQVLYLGGGGGGGGSGGRGGGGGSGGGGDGWE